jgi:hypothetical protein
VRPSPPSQTSTRETRVPKLLLTFLFLAGASQPAWACKNAMGPTGANATVFWGGVGVLAAIVGLTGYYIWSNFFKGD